MRAHQEKPFVQLGVFVRMLAPIQLPVPAAAGEFVSVMRREDGYEAVFSLTEDGEQVVGARYAERPRFVPMLVSMVSAGQAVWFDAKSAELALAAEIQQPIQPSEA